MKPFFIGYIPGLLFWACSPGEETYSPMTFSEPEVALIQSLSIQSVQWDQIIDPSNQYAKNPVAIQLGELLFKEEDLSANGQVACASCHLPEYSFTDPKPFSKGIGTTRRSSMSVSPAIFSTFLFWDGRADSLWSQALGPLESAAEHGLNRNRIAHYFDETEKYRSLYESAFGVFPDLTNLFRYPENASPVTDNLEWQKLWNDMKSSDQETINIIFSNVGKAIAAFEMSLRIEPSRFDKFADSLQADDSQADYTEKEIFGLKLFIGKAGCIGCHFSPMFTNHDFHNTGIPQAPDQDRDHGRLIGVEDLLSNPFNCLGKYSDTILPKKDCLATRFTKHNDSTLDGAFKVPSLRHVGDTSPYMHNSVFSTLEEVIDHYNQAPTASVGHSELSPLNLSSDERDALKYFLLTLN